MGKPFFQRLWTALSPYYAIAGLYLVLLVVLKVVEFFLLDFDAWNRSQLLVNALTYNLVVASWTLIAVGLLFLLVRLFSRRAAVWVAAVSFALLLFSEVGLLFYTLHNGFLLGCELVARPVAESWLAMRGAVGVILPMVLSVVVIGGFIALALWRSKRPSKAALVVPSVVVLFALLSLLFKTSHLVDRRYDYFVLNKSWYLAVDSYHYFNLRQSLGDSPSVDVDYDPVLVAELLSTHPEWATPVDSLYSLERPFVADTFLNAYFTSVGDHRAALAGRTALPNIVIVLVESLGHESMGTGSVPFIDSLAATGLYWPNCLSATVRSYGAIPALTGSVGGPKCFQFGAMPSHNSLLSLLKREGYNTRAYYGGDFTFDCIYEYLTAQHIDYLSPLFERFKSSPASKHSWWGYNDDTLFDYAIRDLNAQPSTHNPHLSVVTTISMHDELKLPDARQQYYQRRAARLPMPPAGQGLYSRYSANLFTDDCLRKFIHAYSQRPDFQNTIFVVVGDHSSGQQKGDILSSHRVPLIVWSPLVKKPARFTHVVTHNDLAPALYSLLVSRYGLTSQPTVHWLGDGLGPSPKTLLVVNYAHEIHDIVYHNYYYRAANPCNPEEFYSFGSDLQLHPCSDSLALDSCRRQLKLMRYLYSYTYYNDRLTAHALNSRHFIVGKRVSLPNAIDCVVPDTPPSASATVEWPVLSAFHLTDVNKGYTTVRVGIESDVVVHDSIYMSQFPDLHVIFDEHIHEVDRLSKFLLGDASYNPGTYHLQLSKEFPLDSTHSRSLSVFLSSPRYDEDWHAGARFTLFNTRITIDYAHQNIVR